MRYYLHLLTGSTKNSVTLKDEVSTIGKTGKQPDESTNV